LYPACRIADWQRDSFLSVLDDTGDMQVAFADNTFRS
jgi:hypothetical protein